MDCDCPEAITAARELLPETGLIFGRQSKPFSHFLSVRPACPHSAVYRSAGPKHACRAARVVIGWVDWIADCGAPSIHETGELVRFERGFEGTPANIDADVLISAVRRVAAAALLTRHWPTQGSRHHAFLALAGVFGRAGWNIEDAKAFHRVIYRCIWPTNPDVAAADSEVQSTFEKHSAGGEVTLYRR
ncbi:MAG: hypothetical protein WKF37_05145 [Bryobacteraceae bacterium]